MKIWHVPNPQRYLEARYPRLFIGRYNPKTSSLQQLITTGQTIQLKAQLQWLEDKKAAG